MMTASNPAEMEGETALPRSNGELIFQAPWEGRAFGAAVALNESGLYEWRDFAEQLSHEIAAEGDAASAETYYERWLVALECLLLDRGVITPEELDTRTEEYESGIRSDDPD